MNPIAILGTGVESGYPSVTSQRRINCYLEFVNDAEKSNIIAYGTPGLTLFHNFGDTPVRGMLVFGDFLYCVHRSTVYKVNNAASVETLGTIGTTTGRVGLACNGQQLMVVDGSTTGYVYEIADQATVTISVASPGEITWTAHGLPANAAVKFTTTGALPTGITAGTEYYVKTVVDADTFTITATPGGSAINTSGTQSGTHTGQSVLTTVTDTDYPGLTTVDFLDGYFLGHVAGTGKFYVSASYDGMSWDALDFATAESNPDNLKSVFVDRGYAILSGDYTTEFWGNTGAADFPFGRIGSAVEVGGVGPWSIAKIGDSVAFVGQNRLGESQVYYFNGSQPTVISTHDIDRILNNATSLNGSTAFSFMTNGHSFYCINVNGETWAYDFKTALWSQLKSHDIARYRGEIAANFINKTIISDYANGKLYRLSDTAYTDNGDPIAMEIVSRHQTNNREYLTINRFEVDFESGIGTETGQGENPQVMLSISKDQGHTFGPEMWRAMGKMGNFKRRAQWFRLGRGWDFTFKIRITDPVKRVITGAYAS